MSGEDALFQVKNHFYLGNFQLAVNEASSTICGSDQKLELDCLVYRSYIGMKNYQLVLGEVSEDAVVDLRAVKMLATYLSPGLREMALGELGTMMEDVASSVNPMVQLMAGYVYAYEQEYEKALRAIHYGVTLEQLALQVQVLLKMNRADLASKELVAMNKMDEDATLTQLTSAYVNMAMGGDKLKEAYFILQELSEKFGGSVLLLNALAVFNMLDGKYDEAEPLLNDALLKNGSDADTLANLATCLPHLAKPPELAARYQTQLKSVAPNHGWVTDMTAMGAAFDRAAEAMA